MEHLIDIILVALMLLVVFISAKRGIILTVFDIAGGIIAFLGAKLFSPYVSEYIYDNRVKAQVLEFLTEKYAGLEGSVADAASGFASVFDFLPEGVLEYAKSSGFLDAEALSSGVLSSVVTVSDLEATIVRPVIAALLNIICFAVIAVLLLIVLRIAGIFIAKLVKKSKLADKMDSLLGGVFGILKGGIYAFILAAVINVISYSSASLATYAGNSYICSFVGKIIGL